MLEAGRHAAEAEDANVAVGREDCQPGGADAAGAGAQEQQKSVVRRHGALERAAE